jgi:uncharacterized protein Smg (DUF494 family)
MNNKIIELIVLILNQIRSKKSINENDFDLLIEEGYNIDEINTAIAWVYSRLNTGELIFQDELSISDSKRFFDPNEKRLLSVDSQGYLIMLLELGVITKSDLDIIIEKIRFSGMENINLENTKIFVTSVIFKKTNFDILEYLTLNNNKTVH